VWGYLNQLKGALQSAGFRGEELLPGNREALGGTGIELRTSAVVALGQIKPGPKDAETKAAVQALRDMLKEKDASVRKSAVVALGELREAGAPAAADMVYILKDADVEPAVVVDSLSKLGKDAVEPLAALLRNSNPRVRHGIVLALGAMGPAASGALREIGAMCRTDPVPEIRAAAVEAFQKIQAKN
jgi:HEAT repeat protein